MTPRRYDSGAPEKRTGPPGKLLPLGGPGFFAAFCSQSMMVRRDQGTARRGQMQAAAARGATDRPGRESSGNERDTSEILVTSPRHRGHVGDFCPGGDRAVLDRPRRGGFLGSLVRALPDAEPDPGKAGG